MTTTVAPPDREQLLASIRGVGHWRARIIPESAARRFKLPSDCRDAVDASAVLLRAWGFPHVPTREDETRSQAPVRDDGWEALVGADPNREFWRLTRSGQFIRYLALREDLEPEFEDERILDRSAAVFTLLETVEFTRRLTGAADYGSGIDLEIDLVHTQDRRLMVLDPMRMPDPLWLRGDEHRASASCVELRRCVPLPLLQSGVRVIARDLAMELFATFGYEANPRAIELIQEQLLQRR